jgi:hypothetical protein
MTGLFEQAQTSTAIMRHRVKMAISKMRAEAITLFVIARAPVSAMCSAPPRHDDSQASGAERLRYVALEHAQISTASARTTESAATL